jgi:ADP-ribose pyrophosphatase YjhB (NUDIX family)
MKPAILERRLVYSGYLAVETLRIRLADGFLVSRDVERHGDAAALVGRLFRAPVFETTGEDVVEEACAGMIEQETDEAAARREAGEELGVTLHVLERVARVWSSPGVSTERQSLFLAAYSAADRTAEGGGVPGEHEGIAVIERPLTQLARELDQGRIVDGKLVTLVYALRHRRPELFVAL